MTTPARPSTGSGSGLYAPAGFYLLRAPVLPASVFRQITEGPVRSSAGAGDPETRWVEARQRSHATLRRLAADPVVEQALMVASTAIFHGLAQLERADGDERRVERAYAGLFRYLVRMSTRPTPFGLFAGVAVGRLAGRTTARLGARSVSRIRTRPDMGWLLSLIELIENDGELRSHLDVVANRLVYAAGDSVVLARADVYGKHDNRAFALRAGPVLAYVLEQAREPIGYESLRQRIHDAFPHGTQAQVNSLLRELWDHHVITSDLRPALADSSPAGHVLERLPRVPATAGLRTRLAGVLDKAAEIDRAGAGGSTRLITDLVARQQELVPAGEGEPGSQHAFQLDTALSLEAAELNEDVGRAVADGVETLLRLTGYPDGRPHLRDYRAAFVERFGMGAEVPVLELLSPERGLDAPPTYQQPPRTYPLPPGQPRSTQARDRILCAILAEALHAGTREIELTDAMVEALGQWEPSAQSSPPPAVEMYLQIAAASPAAIDRGEWQGVVASACMAPGGRTFCRFIDVLGDDAQKALRAYAQRQEALFPGAIFAELSYLPASGRSANVVIRPMLRSYEIVVNSAPSVAPERVIALDDLVVGVSGERFYLRSLSHGREVVVTQSHMLNLMYAPNVCRFLLEVSEGGGPLLGGFDWGAARGAPFLPRVVRNGLVLSPARWHLRRSLLQETGTGSDEARLTRSVDGWRERWAVPRHVYLAASDNRLLLDLEHPLSVAELRRELRRTDEHGSVELQEMLPDFGQLWLQDRHGAPFFAEVVVPVLLREPMREPNGAAGPPTVEASTPRARLQRPVPNEERCAWPGGAWTYLKLYGSVRQQDELIAGPVREIVRALLEESLVDRWFFVRYADPEPHLRLRFRATTDQAAGAVLTDALAWGRALAERGLVGRLTVDSYRREIERYGGPEAIDSIEEAFTADSATASGVIAAIHARRLTLDPVLVAVFTLDALLRSCGLDFDRRLRFVQQRTGRYEHSEEFRTHRRFLCELLASPGTHTGLPARQHRETLDQLCMAQELTLKRSFTHIRELVRQGRLWRQEDELLASLAHLHVNRLLGASSERERSANAFWRHSLESIQRRREAGIPG
jgi:thiopeptide-type bacteriocin biosynthesis protein